MPGATRLDSHPPRRLQAFEELCEGVPHVPLVCSCNTELARARDHARRAIVFDRHDVKSGPFPGACAYLMAQRCTRATAGAPSAINGRRRRRGPPTRQARDPGARGNPRARRPPIRRDTAPRASTGRDPSRAAPGSGRTKAPRPEAPLPDQAEPRPACARVPTRGECRWHARVPWRRGGRVANCRCRTAGSCSCPCGCSAAGSRRGRSGPTGVAAPSRRRVDRRRCPHDDCHPPAHA